MHDTLSKKSNEKCVELSKDLRESIFNHIAQAATAAPGSSQEHFHVRTILHLNDEVPAVGCLIEDIKDELVNHVEESN